ncbi:unnamed protein product [Ambrosiozyma monospora]|uniref:Unnamed protein product n=1 Tax=Ambrosiozyma monospora TaxID=43982 RepID=A0ACB5TZ42_AMBMO|nr:unnamed protein product [Ambrosiozyma monospora]
MTTSTATLKLQGEIPLDQEIENIIRSADKLTVGARKGAEILYGPDPRGLKILPQPTRERLEAAGIDISKGYPSVPDKSEVPIYLDEAFAIRNDDYPYVDRGKSADPEKKALLGAAKETSKETSWHC